MAFEPASGDHKCFSCGEAFKWFQMMESDNPQWQTTEDAGPIPEGEKKEGVKDTFTKSWRVCSTCEHHYRLRVVEEHPIGKNNPEWALLPTIRKEMKKANKGENHWSRGVHYKAACRIIETSEASQSLSKKQKAKAKTEKCTELVEAFAKAIKDGRLFQAFMSANVRLNLGKELDDKVNQLYEEYLNDPEDEMKLKRLEEAEMEVHLAIDYQCAGGDVKILKELDHHNDLDGSKGLFLFDLCRRGVAIQKLETTMQTTKPHNTSTHRAQHHTNTTTNKHIPN